MQRTDKNECKNQKELKQNASRRFISTEKAFEYPNSGEYAYYCAVFISDPLFIIWFTLKRSQVIATKCSVNSVNSVKSINECQMEGSAQCAAHSHPFKIDAHLISRRMLMPVPISVETNFVSTNRCLLNRFAVLGFRLYSNVFHEMAPK